MSIVPNNNLQPDLTTRFIEAVDSLTGGGQGLGMVAAFSGGADSTALVHLLKCYAEKINGRLTLAHLDHGLRGPDGESDLRSAQRMADILDLAFVGDRVDCGALAKNRRLSVEHAARQARYQFLEDVRRNTGSEWVITGHTADDNAELVLMNLLRGAGSQGLAGIPPRRDRIIRPMLKIWRREILDYLRHEGLSWVEDNTNNDTSFTRNRVRHDLIPYLESYNSAITKSLARTADILRAEEIDWDKRVQEKKKCVGWRRSERVVVLDRWKLTDESQGLARRLVREAYRDVRGSIYELTLEHVDHILDLAGSPDGGSLNLPGWVRARTNGSDVEIGVFKSPVDACYEYKLDIPGVVELSELGLRITARETQHPSSLNVRAMGRDAAVLDYDRIVGSLTVRNVRAGDRFQPLGMKGTKKISDFFIDERIPVEKRTRVPLISDSRGIIWVAGHRPAHPVRIVPGTRRILFLELDHLKE